jgi:hypothetical protein
MTILVLQQGFNFQAGLKHVTIDNLISHLDVLLGREVGARLMQAYSIQPGMDPNLFWRRIMELGGDMVFSRECPLVSFCCLSIFAFQNWWISN